VEVQFPHVTDAMLEQLGYEKKNRYSASAFKVRPALVWPPLES
jgi:hypothetical protein